jgi:hypothetical protein
VIGSAVRLTCPPGGELADVACVAHGCDFALLPLDGEVPSNTSRGSQPNGARFPGYIDACNVEDAAGIVDKKWSGCKAM